MRFWFSGPRIFGMRTGVSFGREDLRPAHRSAPSSGKITGGFIYVIRGEHGRVKVGISANPVARLSQLQTGSPFRLQIAWAGALTNFGEHLERASKNTLSRYLVMGEWFDCPEEVAVAAIAGCAHKLGERMIAVDPQRIPEIIQTAMRMH